MTLFNIQKLYCNKVFHPPKVNQFDKNLYSNKHNYCITTSKNGNKITYFEFKPNDNKKNKFIIWSHGDATTAFKKYEYFENLSKLINCTIIVYDYQGYGLSDGTCNEQNCCQDIKSIVEHIKIKYNIGNNNIYLIGKSLGTGIVVDYISKNNWQNPVILISPYKSILGVKFPNLANYLGFMNMFNSISKIKKIKCPIQIIHGTDDKLIDISHGKEIYEKLLNKEFQPIWMEGYGHNGVPLDHNLLINIFDL